MARWFPTAGGVIQFLQHRRDKGRLKVGAMFAVNHDAYLMTAPEGFLVTATNVGRQPITVNGIASREGKNNFLWGQPRNLPKRLESTEQVGEWTEQGIHQSANHRTVRLQFVG